MSRYLIDPDSIRRVRLFVVALTLVGVTGALIVLKPVLGLSLLAFLLAALSIDLWRQGVSAVKAIIAMTGRAERAEGELSRSEAHLASANAQRDASRAQLLGPATLESSLAVVTEMRNAAKSVRLGRIESYGGATRRSVVRFVLDGEVRVTVAGSIRAETEIVSLVGPHGVCVERMRLESDGPSQSVGVCFLSQIEPLQEQLELAGSITPPGYYVETPGAVSETFAGVQDRDVERLEATLETLQETIENAIRNRDSDDR